MSRMPTSPNHHSAGASGKQQGDQQQLESAVPTLRVMRLQSPELHQPLAGSLSPKSLLKTSLCLPDSLAVFVGEKFTAYLGILNASKILPIRKLTVTAQLQTPSQRWQLPSKLDPTQNVAGIDIGSNSQVDAIVSHDIEEAGQHILRVEVSYVTGDQEKTFRKFYRFNVVSPLTVKETSVRSGDSTCYVSLEVSFNSEQVTAATESLVVSSAEFVPADGYAASRIGNAGALLPPPSMTTNINDSSADGGSTDSSTGRVTAVQLLDNSGLLCRGGSFR